jgi:hypothetical protein
VTPIVYVVAASNPEITSGDEEAVYFVPLHVIVADPAEQDHDTLTLLDMGVTLVSVQVVVAVLVF